MASGFMDAGREPVWPPEECVSHGGHCWEQSDCVITTNPPIYHRRCKHCGLVQEGCQQPNMAWHDDPYQPWVPKEGDDG